VLAKDIVSSLPGEVIDEGKFNLTDCIVRFPGRSLDEKNRRERAPPSVTIGAPPPAKFGFTARASHWGAGTDARRRSATRHVRSSSIPKADKLFSKTEKEDKVVE
jgi:hypothetical protein